MKLNKECKRELVAAIIYNLTSVIILLLLKHFKIFDLIGIKPELEIFVWLMAGVAIIASFISVIFSFKTIFRRKR